MNLIPTDVQEKISVIERNVAAMSVNDISNQNEYEVAGSVLVQIKQKYKEIETERKKITEPMDAAKKAVMDFFRKPLEFLTLSETKVKSSLLTYQSKMEQERLAAERKAQEVAREQERKEKEKLQKKIEKAEAKGDAEKAQELQAQKEQVFVPAPNVTSQVQKVNGINTRKVWKFQVTDVASIPREYLTVDEKLLQAVANATKGSKQIPGVRFYQEDLISARS